MKMHLLFVFLLNSFVFSNSHATSFNIRPFSEFTQSASNIVRGTISNVHTENAVTNDGGKTIYTYANLAVKEVFKGSIHSNNVLIRKLGGTKDGTTLEIPSSPEFVENEDTVLFLSTEKEDKSYEVMGLELGKFGLEEKNGATILTGGMFNYSQPGQVHDHDAHTSSDDLTENQKPWSLTDLRALVRKQSNPPASKTTNTSQVNRSPSPALSPANTPEEKHSNGEHPSHSESSSSSFPYWIGGAFLIAVIFFLWKRK